MNCKANDTYIVVDWCGNDISVKGKIEVIPYRSTQLGTRSVGMPSYV